MEKYVNPRNKIQIETNLVVLNQAMKKDLKLS